MHPAPSQYVPKGQGLQSCCLASSWYHPAMHALQAELPVARAAVPVRHYTRGGTELPRVSCVFYSAKTLDGNPGQNCCYGTACYCYYDRLLLLPDGIACSYYQLIL